MSGTNGSHAIDHDTLPPTGCPAPFLCDGLERLIADVGLLREQMARFEANQSIILSEVRKISQALGLGIGLQ